MITAVEVDCPDDIDPDQALYDAQHDRWIDCRPLAAHQGRLYPLMDGWVEAGDICWLVSDPVMIAELARLMEPWHMRWNEAPEELREHWRRLDLGIKRAARGRYSIEDGVLQYEVMQ